MLTTIIIAALVLAVYKLHNRLKSVDPKYREALAEDDAEATKVVEKMRRKATELKERFL